MAIASASRIGTLGAQPAVIQSVTGPIPASGLGMTLTHEHVFSRFGVDPSDAPAYDEAELYDAVYAKAPEFQYAAEPAARRGGARHRAGPRSTWAWAWDVTRSISRALDGT